MARQRIEINKTEFERLCRLQCTLKEIAGWFDCSEDTIQRWCKRTYKKTFAVIYGEKRAGGKISLRRSQWQLAEHNATMAIWLGKQYLDQREPEARQTIRADVTSGGNPFSGLTEAELRRLAGDDDESGDT